MNNVQKYQNVQVMTSDRVRLIIMLYDGMIRFNTGAQKAIAEGDIESRSYNINRSLAIVTELCSSLDMERGGEIAENLFHLYQYGIEQLNTANMKNDSKPIDVFNRIINELKQGWEAISESKAEAPVVAAPEERRSISYGV
jgi:flagellar protein FliS